MARTIICSNGNIEIESNKDILNIQVLYFSYLGDKILYSQRVGEKTKVFNIMLSDTVYLNNTLKQKPLKLTKQYAYTNN